MCIYIYIFICVYMYLYMCMYLCTYIYVNSVKGVCPTRSRCQSFCTFAENILREVFPRLSRCARIIHQSFCTFEEYF